MRDTAQEDPNYIVTPTQIADKFGKIYDGEWSIALEDLLSKRPNSEQESAILLSQMLRVLSLF